MDNERGILNECSVDENAKIDVWSIYRGNNYKLVYEGKCRSGTIEEKMRENRLTWFGHNIPILRYLVKVVMTLVMNVESKMERRRLKKKWMDGLGHYVMKIWLWL